MDFENTYCGWVLQLDETDVHRVYHDHHYGVMIQNDNQLFERLVLEINQAGLSWSTILKKQDGFHKAYDGFDLAKVAAYNESDIDRLLQDPAIIRNRLKIQAAIYNAQVIRTIQTQMGSFYQWLLHHHPLGKEEWVKLFKRHFKFVGGEIVNEFLMSIGLLKGSHHPLCTCYQRAEDTYIQWTNEKRPE